MWSRRELKERAKDVLRRNYWKAFLISIVISIALGEGSGSGGGRGSRGGHNYNPDPGIFSSSIDTVFPSLLLISAYLVVFLIIVVGLRILIGYPLEVGGRRYFVQSAQYFDNRRCFRFAFDGQNYIGIVASMFLKGIFNFLWFLLLIIPGIVKGYSYSMVPYILADNPNIGTAKAIRLSNEMTYGHKLDMFILDLSFLGWYFLGMLALLVGVLFVKPYDYATKAELYLVLRQNALDRGMCSFEDLMLQAPGPNGGNW